MQGGRQKIPLGSPVLKLWRITQEEVLGEGLVLRPFFDARDTYLAALRAVDANENDVRALLEFARS